MVKWLYTGKETSLRRKSIAKPPYKSKKQHKCYTRNFRLSTSSCENKSLITLNWSLKSNKHFHHRLPNCDQGERIKGIYSFVKEYYHKDYTTQFINFNKYFVSYIFLLFCLYCKTFTKSVCTYIKWHDILIIQLRIWY